MISSDVGGQKDLIGSDVGALISLQQDEEKDLNKREFQKEEVDAYVAQIVRILSDDDLREKLGRACREKMRRGFLLKVWFSIWIRN